jgi:hypothetical protein
MSENGYIKDIGIVAGRYNGWGQWYAIEGITNRLKDLDLEGPWAGDIDAYEFYANPPIWAAHGDTPNEALAALMAKQPMVPADVLKATAFP